MSLIAQLGIAIAMVLATTLVHLAGLSSLLLLLSRQPSGESPNRALRYEVLAIIGAALGLFALHGLEIWAYAALFDLLGAVTSFEAALYYSTSTYTTVGYGDVVLGRAWRLIGAIEGANGMILLGWSTAFFVALVGRIRLIERILERRR